MLRSVTLGILGMALVAGGASVSWSLAAEADPDAAVVELNAEKQALQEQERLLADANAAIAGDRAELDEIVKSKADDHEKHLKELGAMNETDSGWPTGIFEDSEAPAPGVVFLGNNRWVGKIGDHYVAVHAGRSGEDPTTGRVLAVSSHGDMDGYTLDLPGTGALTVIAAVGPVVTLKDEDGRLYVLAAAEGRWVG